jgi:serine/threonine-protein kinase HipA
MMRAGDRFTFRATGRDGDWIVKLYGDDIADAVDNEYSMMSLARAVGLNAAECEKIERAQLHDLPFAPSGGDGSALAVRRFDRTPEGRVHQEDFAQIFAVSADQDGKYAQGRRIGYEHLAKLVHAHCGPDDAIEFVRRLAFCIVIGNADAHLKNWSVVYPDRVRSRLSPAYDLVATNVYPGFDHELALALFGERRMERVNAAHLTRLAAAIGLSSDIVLDAATSLVTNLRARWSELAATLPLSTTHRAALDERIHRRWW